MSTTHIIACDHNVTKCENKKNKKSKNPFTVRTQCLVASASFFMKELHHAVEFSTHRAAQILFVNKPHTPDHISDLNPYLITTIIIGRELFLHHLRFSLRRSRTNQLHGCAIKPTSSSLPLFSPLFSVFKCAHWKRASARSRMKNSRLSEQNWMANKRANKQDKVRSVEFEKRRGTSKTENPKIHRTRGQFKNGFLHVEWGFAAKSLPVGFTAALSSTHEPLQKQQLLPSPNMYRGRNKADANYSADKNKSDD